MAGATCRAFVPQALSSDRGQLESGREHDGTQLTGIDQARKGAWQVLLTLAVLVVAFAWAYWVPIPRDPVLRLSVIGVLLQLSGVLTVAWGIAKVRRQFGKPSIWRTFADSTDLLALDMWRALVSRWWSIVNRVRGLVRRLLGKNEVITADVNLKLQPATLESAGSACSTASSPLSVGLDDRVANLEKQLATQRADIELLRMQIASEAERRAQAIAAEQAIRAKADGELRALLDDVQTGGFVLAFAGLISLSFGIVLTSIPDWLASHVLVSAAVHASAQGVGTGSSSGSLGRGGFSLR